MKTGTSRPASRASEATSETKRNPPATLKPASSAWWHASWMTGPSAVGSEKGNCTSRYAAPPSIRPRATASERSGSG